MSGKHRELIQVIVHQLIGLDVHGLVLVRALSMGQSHGQAHRETQRQKVKFQGTNLADDMPRIVRAGPGI